MLYVITDLMLLFLSHSTVDLQYCISFKGTAKLIQFYSLFKSLSGYNKTVCYTVNSCLNSADFMFFKLLFEEINFYV